MYQKYPKMSHGRVKYLFQKSFHSAHLLVDEHQKKPEVCSSIAGPWAIDVLDGHVFYRLPGRASRSLGGMQMETWLAPALGLLLLMAEIR